MTGANIPRELGEPSNSGAAGSENSASLISSLTKTVDGGLKQYRLNNQPIGPSYPIKSQDQDASTATQEQREISRKDSSVIYQPKNPSSPFIKKLKTASDRETQKTIDIRNEIALLLNDGPQSKHFAVEVFSGEKDGKLVYISRRINGFPLSDTESMAAHRRTGELNDAELRLKMDELSGAVKYLNAKGYYHNDITFENIMYDTDKKAMVLVDFENAKRRQLVSSYGSYGEDKVVDVIKGIVVDRARELGANDGGGHLATHEGAKQTESATTSSGQNRLDDRVRSRGEER